MSISAASGRSTPASVTTRPTCRTSAQAARDPCEDAGVAAAAVAVAVQEAPAEAAVDRSECLAGLADPAAAESARLSSWQPPAAALARLPAAVAVQIRGRLESARATHRVHRTRTVEAPEPVAPDPSHLAVQGRLAGDPVAADAAVQAATCWLRPIG